MDVKVGVNIIRFLNVLEVLFLYLIVTASLSIWFLYANGIRYRNICGHRNLHLHELYLHVCVFFAEDTSEKEKK